MWSAFAALMSALVGFGSGLSGMSANFTNPFSEYTQTENITDGTAPLGMNSTCYAPQMDRTLTLTYPNNFVNLTDKRAEMNPSVWGDKPSVFSASSECKNLMIVNGAYATQRTYFLVREMARVPSCKVDELAGPYNTHPEITCPYNGKTERLHRGSCELAHADYFDLRKVAEIPQSGSDPLEIFWVPFSHNAKCIDDVNSNCGPDKAKEMKNLKDFIYVVKKREAFDPANPTDCKALFDSGPENEDACSHYFDVYMAKDIYEKFQSPVAQNDPDYYEYIYFKQNIETCREQATFTPIVDQAGGVIPSQFIDTPFSAVHRGTANGITASTSDESTNYSYFVTNNPVINKEKTSLFLRSSNGNPIDPCPSGFTDSEVSTCYSSLGKLSFQKDTTQVTFQAYSRGDTPQTFYLKDVSGNDPKTYSYILTDETPPTFGTHQPSLQLTAMKFKTQSNHWTWATPWCKPAIYLYPPHPTTVTVKVTFPNGIMTESIPPYNHTTGWDVLADPGGSIQLNPSSNKKYPYLYYEADISGTSIPASGFVWPREDLPKQLHTMLETIGFNQKEISDFHQYWLPKLQEHPYYFVTLLSEDQINTNEPLVLSVKPDTIIRTRVAFEGLNAPVSVPAIQIPSHTRKGFTVTDWGGTLIGKSCTDISVK